MQLSFSSFDFYFFIFLSFLIPNVLLILFHFLLLFGFQFFFSLTYIFHADGGFSLPASSLHCYYASTSLCLTFCRDSAAAAQPQSRSATSAVHRFPWLQSVALLLVLPRLIVLHIITSTARLHHATSRLPPIAATPVSSILMVAPLRVMTLRPSHGRLFRDPLNGVSADALIGAD